MFIVRRVNSGIRGQNSSPILPETANETEEVLLFYFNIDIALLICILVFVLFSLSK